MRGKSSRRQAVQIVVCCYLAFLAGACGRKTSPRPPRQAEMPQVRDLQAQVRQTGVQLTWSIESPALVVIGFNIYRSESPSGKAECQGCPRAYALIGSFGVKPGETRFHAVDKIITREDRFYYRVVPYDSRKRLGPDSNEAEAHTE